MTGWFMTHKSLPEYIANEYLNISSIWRWEELIPGCRCVSYSICFLIKFTNFQPFSSLHLLGFTVDMVDWLKNGFRTKPSTVAGNFGFWTLPPPLNLSLKKGSLSKNPPNLSQNVTNGAATWWPQRRGFWSLRSKPFLHGAPTWGVGKVHVVCTWLHHWLVGYPLKKCWVISTVQPFRSKRKNGTLQIPLLG